MSISIDIFIDAIILGPISYLSDNDEHYKEYGNLAHSHTLLNLNHKNNRDHCNLI